MRMYYGGYGHNPSGKQYVYWGNNNYRTGQSVVAPVTNKKLNKTYNTLFTIMRTTNGDGKMADGESQRLSQKGIGIKQIKGINTLEDLPTGRLIASIEKGQTKDGKMIYGNKKDWKEMSDTAYAQKTRARLMDMEV